MDFLGAGGKEYERLKGYLSDVVEGSTFFSNEEYRNALKPVIKSSFTLAYWLAAKCEKSVDEVLGLFRKYKENYFASEDSLELKEFNIQDISEVKDEINYLRVCVLNICEIDLDNYEREEIHKTFRIYPKETDASAVYKNFFNISSSDKPGQTVDDLILRSHAYQRLNEDINGGTVYIYKTRPKRNIYIKIFLSWFLFFGILVSFALLASSLMNTESKGQLFFMSMVSSFYFFLSLRHLKKTFTNDNFKYTFQKSNFYYTLLFSLFFTWTAFDSGENSWKVAGLGSISTLDGLYKVLWSILLLIILFVCIIYLISYLYLQPEKDDKLVEDILDKHLKDLSKSLIP
ncbi:conserved hypothetical protein [Mycoplasma haemofelis str. Langford 1]|uniref:Uncharacterized protein n=1 Tax=Mycoplasma haemofelis (strain Langford 1) TaxID=941640 RepID=E8ZKG2_MYCHL|nr:hypothetical protein [Mycoplasma haemofelis]CBY92128.1 conserved hypothetical protein [Mycoplasma haemofelis str. Langford 1]